MYGSICCVCMKYVARSWLQRLLCKYKEAELRITCKEIHDIYIYNIRVIYSLECIHIVYICMVLRIYYFKLATFIFISCHPCIWFILCSPLLTNIYL